MAKKMYVVQSENGGFWCGLNSWDVQLRKAQIFHSLKYAGDVVKRFNQYNCKIVEVSLTIVPQTKTRADRIRTMSDEELAELLEEMTYDSMEHRAKYWLRWLNQPAD